MNLKPLELCNGQSAWDLGLVLLEASTVEEAATLITDEARRKLKDVDTTLLWTLEPGDVWLQAPSQVLSSSQVTLANEAAVSGHLSAVGSTSGRRMLAQCAINASATAVLLCTSLKSTSELSECEAFFTAMCPYLVDVLEKAQLRAAVERLGHSEKLQRALFSIANLASSELDMPEMLQNLHRIVNGLMYAENFYIALYDPITDTIRFVYFADVAETDVPDLDEPLPMHRFERGLTWYLIRDGHSLMGTLAQLREQVSGPLSLRGIDSLDWLGVPMIDGTSVLGALVVQSYTARPSYTPEDKALLSFVASHILTTLERKRAHQKLRRQQAELDAVNDCSPLGLFRADCEGNYIYINQAYERISGLRTDQALMQGWEGAIHPEDHRRVMEDWKTAMRLHASCKVTFRFVHASRRVVCAAVQTAPLTVDGIVIGHVGSVEDVTARRDAEDALQRSERRIRTIADAVPAMVCYADSRQRIVFANTDYARAYRRPIEEIIGKTLAEVLGETIYARRKSHIERAIRGEQQIFEDEDGTREGHRSLQLTYIPQFAEDQTEVLGIHIMAIDISATKHREHHLIQLAERDSLTGLANRVGFMSRLSRAMERSGDQQTPMAVLYLDIDHFKKINDTHGHGVGDSLLLAFAERLSSSLRVADVACRLGGDEFSVITEGVRRPEYAAATAAKIVSVMRRPFILLADAVTLSISVSVGLALNTGTDITPEQLLKHADAALYRAKASGRDTYAMTGATKLLDLH